MPRRSLAASFRRPRRITDPAAPIEKVRQAAIDAHIPLIEEAGTARRADPRARRKSSTARTSARRRTRTGTTSPSRCPGPTTELMAQYAKKYQMAMVVPVYEREQAGVYYNTAAVFDADGTYLGKYRKNHIPHTSGFWEKYFFKPGNLGYPVFKTRYATIGVYICYDRHFPEGARLLGLNGAEIVFNPSATVAGLSQYLWKLEQPAHAVANGYFMACSNRVGTEAPWNIGRFYGSSYFVDPRGNFLATGIRGQGRAGRRRDGPRHDRRGPPRLAVLSRPPAGDVRPDGGAAAMSTADQERHDRHRDRHVPGRRARRGREDHDDRHVARRCRPTGSSTRRASTCFPGGIDVHTHLDMPFGGTTSADDFESGTIAAAHGGTTTIVDFAIQYRGQTLHHAWETWMKKAEGKAAIDYGFHMIITELNDQVELEMDALVRQGVTSFKLFMAYPGRLHARRREHLQGAAADREERRHDLHARRERRRDRRARRSRRSPRARPRRSITR